MIVLKQINIKAYKATHSVIIICYMDTVINVVPNADISKKHKITFFSIISKISTFTYQNFIRIYLGVVRDHPVQKIGVFYVKCQGKIKK